MIAGRILKALLVSLMLAVSAYAVAKLNMFGLEGASDRLADRVYQRITAADYGADRVGQRAIRVIYLDESSVEALKSYGWNRWPATYDQQWMMFDDLLNVGGAPPSAMFVDFVYLGQGGPNEGFETFVSGLAAATHAAQWADKAACTADPLVKIACIEAAGGVPIIFSKPSPSDLDLFTDTQARIDGVAVLASALVNPEAYPLIIKYDFDAAKAQRLGVHGFDVTPAMAMYTAWCLRRADACGVPNFRDLKARAAAALAGRNAPPDDYAAVFDAPLDVVWGSRPDPDYLRLTQAVTGRAAPCRKPGADWITRLGEQMTDLRGPAAGARQECPYALTFGYDRMAAGTGLQADDLKTLLAGRLVVVGGQFRASNDWVESPVHGQAPGVHLHAMALDNLLEDGVDYRRNATMMLDSDLLKSVLVAALAFCGVLGVMARNSLLDHAIETRMEPKLRGAVYGPLYLAIFGASILMVAATTWIGVKWLHRSPINWIGITACAMGFLAYATRQTLPADILGSIEDLPWVRRVILTWRQFQRTLKFEEDRLVKPRPRPPAPPENPSDTPPDRHVESPADA